MTKGMQAFFFPLIFSLLLNLSIFATTILDFDTAAERVLQRAFKLKIAETEIQAKAAEKRQMSFYPNPIFSYEIDEIAGHSKDWRSIGSNGANYEISQLIELGGKRRKRQQIASYYYQSAQANYEASQIELLNELSKSFVDVFAAQEQFSLRQEQGFLVQQMLNIIEDKIEAGKENLIQKVRAEMTLSSAHLAEQQAWNDLLIAKDRLAILWGDVCPDFEKVNYPFYTISSPQSLSSYLAEFCQRPEIARAYSDYLAAKETVRLEKARRIPDVTVSVGYGNGEAVCENGWLLGVAVPLPVFDRNQGNISRAYSQVQRAKNEIEQTWLILESKMSIAYKEFVQAYKEVNQLTNHVLQKAYQSLEFIQEGHQQGKFDLLDVINSRQLILEIRQKQIDLLIHYHYKKADINYLNGQID